MPKGITASTPTSFKTKKLNQKKGFKKREAAPN
jgi:hypothetical protein